MSTNDSNNISKKSLEDAYSNSSNLLNNGVPSHQSTNTFFKSTSLCHEENKYLGSTHVLPVFFTYYDTLTPGNTYGSATTKEQNAHASLYTTPVIVVLNFDNKAYHEISKYFSDGTLANKDNLSEDEFKFVTSCRMGTDDGKLNQSIVVVFGGVKIIGLTFNIITSLMRMVFTYRHISTDTTGYDPAGKKIGHSHSKFDVNEGYVAAGA
ncbi:hypothetical protein AB836_00745 [Rickettsiales bacterium (ex Bugula neritina AB1)]|nr:hypothetical protein AB836_00745 [Rickettsiales bacterium (ex Bugula neritina AB1)]